MGSVVKYGGHFSGLALIGDTLTVNDFHSGGDTLWGGANNDVLIGGAGTDNFLCGLNEGVDFVTNSDWLDTVNLYNITLNDIGGIQVAAGNVIVGQDANNAVAIQFTGVYSPLIKLADGSQYRYNGANDSWQNV